MAFKQLFSVVVAALVVSSVQGASPPHDPLSQTLSDIRCRCQARSMPGRRKQCCQRRLLFAVRRSR